jgi:type II secretory pathway pseudopilin PulG
MTTPERIALRKWGAFTLLEVVLSMGILALLAASVYAIVNSSIGASRAAMDEQLTLRRLDAFLRVTRDAFLNLPATGTVTLESGKSRGGDAEQRLILGRAQGLFGLPSLAGGSLVLSSRPKADGTRTITLLRIPANASDREREQALAAPGIPLLPKVRKPRWSFFQEGNWKEEWPAGNPRPSLVRLQMEVEELPDEVEAIFYLPTLATQQPPAKQPPPPKQP